LKIISKNRNLFDTLSYNLIKENTMARDLFDGKKIVKSHLTDINDVKFLLKHGYTPARLLVFHTVPDDILKYLLILMATDPLRAN